MMSPNLIDGFLRSASRFATHQALVVDDASLTYEELRAKAECIAGVVRGCQSRGAELVAVLANRGVAAYESVLGVLRAGCGYVPLNSTHPTSYTANLLDLARCQTVIAAPEALSNLQGVLEAVERGLHVIVFDAADAKRLAAVHSRHRFLVVPRIADGAADDLEKPAAESVAYLMFTSGSTGVPKGVPITHRSARAYVEHMSSYLEISCDDRVSQMHDLGFDFSIHDLFVCWERGACLYRVSDRVTFAPSSFIRQHRISVWASVPSVAVLMRRIGLLRPNLFPSIRRSVFCGGPLPADLAAAWSDATPNGVVDNMYGPTEATVGITIHRWRPEDTASAPRGIIPIGHPFPGHSARVVGDDGVDLPNGVVGELWVSGPQVASGYWEAPGLTKDRFVLSAGPNAAQWYRTGDLVQQGKEGEFHFVGRRDTQLKVRGHRVELSQIEAVIRGSCPAFEVVCVGVPGDLEQVLGIAAFVVGQPETLDEAAIVQACERQLPSYMVPQIVRVVDALPLTSRGKVDRKALVHMLQQEDSSP